MTPVTVWASRPWGNLTSTTRYQNAAAATGAIVRNFTYDTLGNLLTAQVDCCQLEQWVYTSTTQFAYAERVVRGPSTGPQLTTTESFDFNTGLVSSQTDPNGQTTSFSYDLMKRTTRINGPLGANTTLSYDDSSAQPSTTSSTALDATNRVVRLLTTDGLGRNTQQQTRNASGTTYSVVDTQYDALGRVTAASNPHGPTETAVWTTNSYDALGRVTVSTPPGNAGAYQYSYSGNMATVTDPAGKQRRKVTDASGRIVQVHEPGYSDGTPGTGSVTISGTEASIIDLSCEPIPGRTCPRIYDGGSVWITVNGFTATVSYGRSSTSGTIAAALASVFNNDVNSPVTATASGSTVSLAAKKNGVISNYSLSANSATNDPADFGSASFTATPSGPTLTGGTDGTGANGSQPSISTPLVTLYSYDPLNNLTLIQQGVQVRQFIYDGLGRLTSQTTPEAGAVQFTYTDFGTVATRTDARGVVTNYGYDGLHRLTSVTYSVPAGSPATPTVNFYYDEGGAAANALGRLTHFTDGVGSESYQYDALGRATSLSKTISGTTYLIGPYQYNLASELTAITYPSGRQVLQQLDPIGRLTQVQSGGVNYLSSIAYNSSSLPTGVSFGNGVTESYGYNARLQLASLAYSNSSQTLLSLAYNYGTGDNGQIQGITDNLDATKSTSYTYDAWARLKTAQNGQWGLSWSYDRYGNRTAQTVTAGTGPSSAVTVNANTNRLTDPAYAYDAAGNMTNDGLNVLAYDAENRVVTSTAAGVTTTYAYDGNGLRVKKVTGGTTTVYIFLGGRVIAEYVNGAAPSSATREYIYSGGQILAKIEGGTTQYYHADHLSVRLMTDANGTVLVRQGQFPFGESWYASGTATKWQFTSYERDAESGNDYALARYYVNRLGRFNLPDPVAGDAYNPQRLNRYAYVLNDPINLTDPLGLDGDDWDEPMREDSGGGGGAGGTGYQDPLMRCFSATENNWGCLMGVEEARLQAFFGDKYYDLPGKDNPAAQAEAAYEKQVAEGLANLAEKDEQAQQAGPTDKNGVPCEQKILNTVNAQFGTNFTGANVTSTFPNGGATNLVINATSATGLTPSQFNAVQPGRYTGIVGYLTGLGPSLHIPGPGFFDPQAVFSSSNVGGSLNITFTAHIDSAFAWNPIGAVVHLFKDIFGSGSRNPCP